MTRSRDMARLTDLAQLVLDHRLAALRRSADALAQSRMQLSALNLPSVESGLAPVEAERVALAYQRWADARRSDLNLVIARQTAACLDARGEASLALGRRQALQGVTARPGRGG
jgi:hypothetical protein